LMQQRIAVAPSGMGIFLKRLLRVDLRASLGRLASAEEIYDEERDE
jgi:hypothetical protein